MVTCQNAAGISELGSAFAGYGTFEVGVTDFGLRGSSLHPSELCKFVRLALSLKILQLGFDWMVIAS
jgi:hypothetical protein